LQLKDQIKRKLQINTNEIILGMYRRCNNKSDQSKFQIFRDDHCKLKHYHIHHNDTVRVRIEQCKRNKLGFGHPVQHGFSKVIKSTSELFDREEDVNRSNNYLKIARREANVKDNNLLSVTTIPLTKNNINVRDENNLVWAQESDESEENHDKSREEDQCVNEEEMPEITPSRSNASNSNGSRSPDSNDHVIRSIE